MIVLLIVLWSLCAIYITHLLYQKNMKIAATAVAVLYTNIVIWTYLIFILDVANLGFKESRVADIVGSSIFHSFTDLRDLMSVMPQNLNIATASVSILIASSVLIQLIISSIRIYQAVVSHKKKSVQLSRSGIRRLFEVPEIIKSNRKIYILHCRLND